MQQSAKRNNTALRSAAAGVGMAAALIMGGGHALADPLTPDTNDPQASNPVPGDEPEQSTDAPAGPSSSTVPSADNPVPQQSAPVPDSPVVSEETTTPNSPSVSNPTPPVAGPADASPSPASPVDDAAPQPNPAPAPVDGPASEPAAPVPSQDPVEPTTPDSFGATQEEPAYVPIAATPTTEAPPPEATPTVTNPTPPAPTPLNPAPTPTEPAGTETQITEPTPDQAASVDLTVPSVEIPQVQASDGDLSTTVQQVPGNANLSLTNPFGTPEGNAAVDEVNNQTLPLIEQANEAAAPVAQAVTEDPTFQEAISSPIVQRVNNEAQPIIAEVQQIAEPIVTQAPKMDINIAAPEQVPGPEVAPVNIDLPIPAGLPISGNIHIGTP